MALSEEPFLEESNYADYDALEKAAMDAWQFAVIDEELVRTVCAAPYLNRATSD